MLKCVCVAMATRECLTHTDTVISLEDLFDFHRWNIKKYIQPNTPVQVWIKTTL